MQRVVEMRYNWRSMRLVVLEEIDKEHVALKRLKVKSMYEKVEVLTECIKT